MSIVSRPSRRKAKLLEKAGIKVTKDKLMDLGFGTDTAKFYLNVRPAPVVAASEEGDDDEEDGHTTDDGGAVDPEELEPEPPLSPMMPIDVVVPREDREGDRIRRQAQQ